MTVKSTIDIDINDAAFTRFHALWTKYQTALGKMPADWAKVNKAVATQRTGFESIVAAMLAQAELSKKREKSENKEADSLSKFEKSWRRISEWSKNTARSAADITRNLLRWTALGSIATGLVGAGSLFGLDRLAGAVGAGRRSALGLGVGYGAQQAFGVNFGRFVDPNSFLSSVAEALSDQSKRAFLGGIGLTGAEQQGDTAQVSVRALQRLKSLADRTPADQLAQVMQATGAGQFLSLEDFRRLRNTSQDELSEQTRSFGGRAQALDFDDRTLKRWQDFNYQLELAGKKIQSAFITGLDPLIKSGVLDKLSDGFANAVKTFSSSPKLQEWMGDLAKGLEGFANYIASDKFQQDTRTFVEDIAALAHAIHSALQWLGVGGGSGPFTPLPPNTTFVPQKKSLLQRWHVVPDLGLDRGRVVPQGFGVLEGSRNKPPGSALNNPGNLRRWRNMPTVGGFAQFPTMEAGIQAMADQLRLYQDRDKLNTIRQFVSKYSPNSENDTATSIKNISNRTGFGPDQALNLQDKGVLSTLISAMTKQENSKSNISPKVVITILNNTGGSAIVTTSQLAVQ